MIDGAPATMWPAPNIARGHVVHATVACWARGPFYARYLWCSTGPRKPVERSAVHALWTQVARGEVSCIKCLAMGPPQVRP